MINDVRFSDDLSLRELSRKGRERLVIVLREMPVMFYRGDESFPDFVISGRVGTARNNYSVLMSRGVVCEIIDDKICVFHERVIPESYKVLEYRREQGKNGLVKASRYSFHLVDTFD